MKKVFLFICICSIFFTSVTFSQQKQLSVEERKTIMEQKADSAIANRTIMRMKELFKMTAEQEQALYKTGISVNNNRRQVFKTYWKSEAFRTQIAKIDSTADASYVGIVGVENYKLYKDVLKADFTRTQAIKKQRADIMSKDTLTSKTTNP